ncbi:MAG: hypothetical protein IKT38_01425 [Clostridia bacterium]|nr:hypothetical protein [Clostridia bacterium]
MESILTAVIGLICIILGVFNRKGNISTLHSYHRKRVSEEDRLPFGKMVGLGTIIVGIALILMGGFSFAANLLQKDFYLIIGTVILIIGLVVGLAISFYAMIKYNKGIF